MEIFFQILINSIIIGSLYGIIAMSFALAYRTTRFFNLAHGAVAAIGGYTFFWLGSAGAGFTVSLIAAILDAGIIGFLIDRFIYAPQRKRKASATVLLVVSLGVMTVIESVISMMFGTQFKPLVSISDLHSFPIGPAFVTEAQVWIIAVNFLVLTGLLFFLYKTKTGKMTRAIADDVDVSRTLGIRTDYYIGIIAFISAAIAGLAGVLMGLDTGLQPTMGFYLLLKAVIAVIIGCSTSIPGAFLGAFLLAFSENCGVYFLASEWRDPIAFAVLLIFLLFRPQGILGGKGE